MGIIHNVVATGANDSTKQVSKDAWNDEHVISLTKAEFDTACSDGSFVFQSDLGTGVATFLATPSSANLASALTTKTGTGLNVFDTSPSFTTGITVTNTSTSTANTNVTIENVVGTLNNTGDTQTVYVGQLGDLTYTGAGNIVSPGHMIGTFGNIIVNAAGRTIDLVIGAEGKITNTDGTITSAVAVHGGLASNAAGKTITTLAMLNANVTSNAGTISNFFGSQVNITTSGTITNLIGYSQRTPVNTGTITNLIGFQMQDGSASSNVIGFYGQVTSGTGKFNLFCTGSAPSVLTGGVKLGASTTPAQILDVVGNGIITGNFTIVGTGGLGYGTGSGGAVTQATSRTTGVTLNKTNGAITLVSAAGTATWQTFTVTNSTVAATDVVRVSQKSGTDLNMIQVTATAAGSFNISFATTGGITTEQPVFNFAVIKAVAA
ncbi:MAG: hypothetical protein ACYC36_03820 [Bellilinea sp.]